MQQSFFLTHSEGRTFDWFFLNNFGVSKIKENLAVTKKTRHLRQMCLRIVEFCIRGSWRLEFKTSWNKEKRGLSYIYISHFLLLVGPQISFLVRGTCTVLRTRGVTGWDHVVPHRRVSYSPSVSCQTIPLIVRMRRFDTFGIMTYSSRHVSYYSRNLTGILGLSRGEHGRKNAFYCISSWKMRSFLRNECFASLRVVFWLLKFKTFFNLN